MISKKLATSLGAGTLGAGGAAAAAALNMGNKSQNEDSQSLDIDLSPDAEVQQSDQRVKTQDQASEDRQRESGTRNAQGTTPKSPFDGAGSYDIKAFNSSNWKTLDPKKDEITIKVEEGNETWQCTIKGVVFDNDQSKRQTIKTQVEEFVRKINENEENKKKFVKNCADARLNSEKTTGKVSTIELEVEKNTGKLKNLDNLLSGDFVGLRRLDEEYGDVIEGTEISVFIDPNWDKDNKKMSVTIKRPDSSIICSISGKIEDSDFRGHWNFDEPLGGIFMSETDRDDEGNVRDAYTKNEKKKFLFRNCLNRGGKIENMKIVSYTDKNSSKKWKFENLDELLLTKIYTNP